MVWDFHRVHISTQTLLNLKIFSLLNSIKEVHYQIWDILVFLRNTPISKKNSTKFFFLSTASKEVGNEQISSRTTHIQWWTLSKICDSLHIIPQVWAVPTISLLLQFKPIQLTNTPNPLLLTQPHNHTTYHSQIPPPSIHQISLGPNQIGLILFML